MYTGKPTVRPAETAWVRRSCSSLERGPGSWVVSRRRCSMRAGVIGGPPVSEATRGKPARDLLVDEGPVVEVHAGQLAAVRHVVLLVLPGDVVALAGHEVQVPRDVPGVEVVRVDPGSQLHALVLAAELGDDDASSEFVHVREQPAHEVAQEVDAKRP